MLGDEARIRYEASRWALLKADGLSTSQQKELQAWLAKDRRHWGALRSAEELDGHLKEILPRYRGTYVVEFPPAGSRFNRRALLTMGTSAVALTGIGLLVRKEWLDPVHGGIPHQTGVGEMQTVLLRQAQMILNTATRMVIDDYDPRHHEASLIRGEAMVTVPPGVNALIVRAGDWILRAVGVTFDVRRYVSSFNVVVTEGTLEVLGPPASAVRPLRLAAYYDADLGATAQVRSISSKELERRLAWRTGRVVFMGQSVREAVAEINRYRTRRIVLTDPRVLGKPFSGSFLASDTKGFINSLKLMYHLEEEINGSEIILRPRSNSN